VWVHESFFLVVIGRNHRSHSNLISSWERHTELQVNYLGAQLVLAIDGRRVGAAAVPQWLSLDLFDPQADGVPGTAQHTGLFYSFQRHQSTSATGAGLSPNVT
jgi:hypothetical protein